MEDQEGGVKRPVGAGQKVILGRSVAREGPRSDFEGTRGRADGALTREGGGGVSGMSGACQGDRARSTA